MKTQGFLVIPPFNQPIFVSQTAAARLALLGIFAFQMVQQYFSKGSTADMKVPRCRKLIHGII